MTTTWPHAHVYPGDLVAAAAGAASGYVVVVGWDDERHAAHDADADEDELAAYEGVRPHPPCPRPPHVC